MEDRAVLEKLHMDVQSTIVKKFTELHDRLDGIEYNFNFISRKMDLQYSAFKRDWILSYKDEIDRIYRLSALKRKRRKSIIKKTFTDMVEKFQEGPKSHRPEPEKPTKMEQANRRGDVRQDSQRRECKERTEQEKPEEKKKANHGSTWGGNIWKSFLRKIEKKRENEDSHLRKKEEGEAKRKEVEERRKRKSENASVGKDIRTQHASETPKASEKREAESVKEEEEKRKCAKEELKERWHQNEEKRKAGEEEGHRDAERPKEEIEHDEPQEEEEMEEKAKEALNLKNKYESFMKRDVKEQDDFIVRECSRFLTPEELADLQQLINEQREREERGKEAGKGDKETSGTGIEELFSFVDSDSDNESLSCCAMGLMQETGDKKTM